MYYPREPKEPSGCMQTIIITRMMLGILLVPVTLIFLMVLAVLLFFFALSVHPLLALLVVAIAVIFIVSLALWESRRIARENPRDE